MTRRMRVTWTETVKYVEDYDVSDDFDVSQHPEVMDVLGNENGDREMEPYPGSLVEHIIGAEIVPSLECKHCGMTVAPDPDGSWIDVTGGDECDNPKGWHEIA